MEFSRRRLLQWGMVHTAAVMTRTAHAEPAPLIRRRSGPSILQGATCEARTQFSIVHPAADRLSFVVRDLQGLTIMPDKIEVHTMHQQSTVISKAYFSNLYLGADFILVVLNDAGQVVEEREFRMLDTRKADLRLAICSCMDEGRHQPEIWQDLVAQAPDVIFFAGDSTYCDYREDGYVGPALLWKRFSEARAVLEIYFSRKLIPIFATWDDHDFGKNNSGVEYPFVLESQRNFMQFFAMDPSHCSVLERGPGVSSRLLLGGQQYIFMDDRSYRVARFSEERYAHWGREQEEWMLNYVNGFDGRTWIINGSQVFPHMLFKESLSGDHPKQFEAVCTALAQSGRRVAFISGDVHFSEISEIEATALGYTTYELTASSIHSKPFPGVPDIITNDRRIVATAEHNYLLVEMSAGSSFQVESRSANNQVNFTRSLSVT